MYFHYFHFGLNAWADRVLLRVRHETCQIFLKALAPSETDTILDVGISENDHISSNYLEKTWPHPRSIIAMGIEPYPSLKAAFPAITLLCGDARALPLADESVDFVYSHAVIEHLGSRENQARFLAEAFRVCRKGLMVTTPNRWHPIETHIGLPLLHYLPPALFRRLCAALGKRMYASEETLNLLDAGELLRMARALPVGPERIEIHTIRWLGFVSNLALAIGKPPAGLTP
jgi:hypothetical protein